MALYRARTEPLLERRPLCEYNPTQSRRRPEGEVGAKRAGEQRSSLKGKERMRMTVMVTRRQTSWLTRRIYAGTCHRAGVLPESSL